MRATDAAGLREFVTRHGRVMVKVPDSLSGHGIAAREAASVADWDAFRAELLDAGQFLVEEFIHQHPVMASLCPTSVNSLRMITYLDAAADDGAGRVHLLASVLKIGNGGDIDNFSGGGMYTMVDEAGVALYPAFDGTGQTYAVHPLTGTPIVGFAVPEFAAVLEMLDRASRVEPAVPYVGWDVAITPTGPVIIEGNPNSGVFQAKPQRVGGAHRPAAEVPGRDRVLTRLRTARAVRSGASGDRRGSRGAGRRMPRSRATRARASARCPGRCRRAVRG